MQPSPPSAHERRFWWRGGPFANTPADGAISLALLLVLGLNPNLPQVRALPLVVVFFALGALFLMSRSLVPLWIAALAATVAQRLLPTDSWADQTFVQLSSLAALLNGHGIYDMANGIGMSWSIYLPMADTLAAFPVWFLGAKFWNFFQVLVPLVYSLPFWVAPSQVTFRLFLGLTAFLPFAGLTARGNALEISVATLFAGFWLLLRGRFLPLAAALLGYAALLRQPLLFTVPFVAIALWRRRAWKALASYAAVLFFGGFVHVARNPSGFVASTFTVWAEYADMWFHKLGTKANYSISTLLLALGDEGATGRARQPLYLALLALALVALMVAAWRRGTVESAVIGAIVAVLLAHFLNRGFVLYRYVVAAALPALAFVGLERRPALPSREPPERREARLLAAAVGGAIVVLVATPLVLAAIGEASSWRGLRGNPVALASLQNGEVESSWFLGQPAPRPPLGASVGTPLVLGLAEPAIPRELLLAGAKIPPRQSAGVTTVYPTTIEVVGFLRSGRIEGSADGARWIPLARFRTWAHPSFYPTRIALDSHGEAVRFLRIVDGATWWGQDSWLFGGAEVYGDPPRAGG